jgi:sialate O-acetylesterase
VIAVRVFDSELSGGILEGNPSIQVQRLPVGTLVNLAGIWKFNRGDHLLWMQPAFNDETWTEHKVPLAWSQNGLQDYDGFGWYRVSFIASRSWEGTNLTLELGRIDDVDEVYLNGVLIGSMGPVPGRNQPGIINSQWSIVRRYRIPEGLLRYGKSNVLAVRVYDDRLDGGLMGPYTVIRRTDAITPGEWAESMPPPVEYRPPPTDRPWWERLIWWQ